MVNQDSNKILINMLNLANLTKARCEQFLGKHKNSLDTYIYRYHGVEFPSSFAFFFLNSISTSLLPNYKMSKKKSKANAKLEKLSPKKQLRKDVAE